MSNTNGFLENYIIFSKEDEIDFEINRKSNYFDISLKNDPEGEWSYDTHTRIIDKLPGMVIYKDENYLRENIYQTFSCLKKDDIIYCFKLETDNSNPSCITFQAFTDVKYLFLYLFSNELTVSLKLCSYLNIISPKDVFLNYLKSNSIYLLGYKTRMDFNGYDTLNLWLLKKHTFDNWSLSWYHFNAKDYTPDNNYFGVDGWANIMQEIIDNNLTIEEIEKPKSFNLVLEELTDQNLNNFHRNILKAYENDDTESISYLNSVMIGSSFIVNW